jgi:hypothetical protein
MPTTGWCAEKIRLFLNPTSKYFLNGIPHLKVIGRAYMNCNKMLHLKKEETK